MDSKDKVINDLLSRIAKLEYEVEELQKENDLDHNLNKSLLKDIDKAGKEIERLNNIIKEAINYIDDNTYYKSHKGHINIDGLYIILQKGSDKE